MGERTIPGEADYEHAQRLLKILLHIASMRNGVSSKTLRDTYYPNKLLDSQRKYLRRDLEELRSFGVVLDEERATGQPTKFKLSEATWADTTWAEADTQDSILSLIDLQCRPLLSDPTFDNTAQLSSALAKLRTIKALTFDSPESLPGQSRSSNTYKLMEACALGHLCNVEYTVKSGEAHAHVLEPYGYYRYGSHTYFVCGDHDNSSREARRYRDDRFVTVKQSAETFEKPSDFDANRYRLLPFQVGKSIGTTTFRKSDMTTEDLKMLVGPCGTVSDDGARASVAYSDVGKAASWAVANGLVPLNDDDVCQAWTAIVNGSSL